MKVITLDEMAFEQACDSLAVKISGVGNVAALIGIRTGGATVAKLIFNQLENQGEKLKYYEVGASRYATATKNSRSLKILFKCVPVFVLDWLRVIEYYIVCFRMMLFDDAERSLCLDDDLVDYLTGLNGDQLIVIDDAIDSGSTVKILSDTLHLINPKLVVKVAVLVVTQKKPLVMPDVFLYRNVLIRFPWSSDFKR